MRGAKAAAAIALIFGWAWSYQLVFRDAFYAWVKSLPLGLGFPVAVMVIAAGAAMLMKAVFLLFAAFDKGDAA